MAEPVFNTIADASVLKLAKDVPVFARQNIGVRIDFFPFNQWERELLVPEKHVYDEEGRCYRYDLWNGRLSFARTKEDVKDAPASDWPHRHRPKPDSKRWRRKHVMETMVRDMGCRSALCQGVQDVATCRAVVQGKMGERYVVKALRSVLYFQNMQDALGAADAD